jgi:hypothetical protein
LIGVGIGVDLEGGNTLLSDFAGKINWVCVLGVYTDAVLKRVEELDGEIEETLFELLIDVGIEDELLPLDVDDLTTGRPWTGVLLGLIGC